MTNKNNVKILNDWSKFHEKLAFKKVYCEYYTVLKAEAEGEKNNPYSFIRFNKIYNNISEMIEDLKKIYIPKKREPYGNPFSPIFRGYEVIYSMAYYVQVGWTLSEKQINLCKKLAVEIHKAAMCADFIDKD